MAPLRPLPDKSAAPTKSILKHRGSQTSLTPVPSSTATLFPLSKKDKRRIKHSQLLSKVTKSSSKPKRRRPNKKLVTTLDSLADALPDDDVEGETEPNGITKAAARSKLGDQVNIIQRKSIKSKPGAMKRRQKVDNDERDRFAKNMAQMAVTASGAGPEGVTPAPMSSVEKLRALRGFISQTLEKRPGLTVASAG